MNTNLIKRQMLMELLQLFDIIVIGTVFILAMALTTEKVDLRTMLSLVDMRISLPNILFLAIYSAICHLIFRTHGMYDSHRLTGFYSEIITILKVCSFCTVVLFVGNIIYEIRIVNLKFINYYLVMLIVFFILNRLILRFLLGVLRIKGRNLRKVLIVGKNHRSEKYARKIITGKKLGYMFGGYVDLMEKRDTNDNSHIVCDLSGFREYVRKNVVDEIFLFLPIKSFYNELSEIVATCEEQGIIVRMCTDLFRLKLAKAKVEQVDSDMLITLFTGNMNRSSVIVKEFIDVFLATICIILASPVMIVAALLIKIFSPGPVFFTQERIGLHKRKFKIYKFRTMYVDAEKQLEKLAKYNEMGADGAFKMKDDPRVTPIGKFFRKYSIDELPQLFNVLKGDMSLIGPRPLTIRDYNGFSIDNHRRRFSVKPGLTCLWQISGRSGISFNDWMKLDMEYIDNWSLKLDMKIFVKTVVTVVTARGAH